MSTETHLEASMVKSRISARMRLPVQIPSQVNEGDSQEPHPYPPEADGSY
jgi:hypothetical protein